MLRTLTARGRRRYLVALWLASWIWTATFWQPAAVMLVAFFAAVFTAIAVFGAIILTLM